LRELLNQRRPRAWRLRGGWAALCGSQGFGPPGQGVEVDSEVDEQPHRPAVADLQQTTQHVRSFDVRLAEPLRDTQRLLQRLFRSWSERDVTRRLAGSTLRRLDELANRYQPDPGRSQQSTCLAVLVTQESE